MMVAEITHDNGCKQAEASLAAFTQRWPSFCRYCDAYGAIYYSGNRWEPPSSDVCGHCLDSGNCPRCNAPDMEWNDSGYAPCKHCGWDEQVIADPAKKSLVLGMVAPIWECLCWMNPENNPEVDV